MTRTVAEVVGEVLADLGVGHAFGVVGSGNFAVTNALLAKGVPFVAARHEGGARRKIHSGADALFHEISWRHRDARRLSARIPGVTRMCADAGGTGNRVL